MKSHTFNGIRYHVTLGLNVEGYTVVPGPEKWGEICIDGRMRGRKALEVAVHEAMHAEDPKLSEEIVTRRAKSLARFLWRLGYRMKENRP